MNNWTVSTGLDSSLFNWQTWRYWQVIS